MEYKETRQNRADFPTGYQKDSLVVLMCDPSRVYAFWQVPEAGKALVLRLNAASARSGEDLIEIAELTAEQQIGSAYLEVPAGGRLQLLWGEWSEGNFQAQLSSNTLLLPEWNPGSTPREGECQTGLVGYTRYLSVRA